MRIFKTKGLARFARRQGITDRSLNEAIERASDGLVDADLGGGVIKQRVARTGEGRRGGYRTLIAYRSGTAAVFMFGFAKNERDNIDSRELATLQMVAAQWFSEPDKIARDARAGILIEVKHAAPT
jgi:hypothetical protein